MSMRKEDWKQLAAKMPRPVIRDLLPLYLSGEASEETNALVTEYLEGDSELRGEANAERTAGIDAGKSALPALSPALELRALRRTRALLLWQRLTYAWALGLTVASLGGVGFIRDGRMEFHFFFRDYPQVFYPCLSAAVSLWIAHFILQRRLRSTGL